MVQRIAMQCHDGKAIHIGVFRFWKCDLRLFNGDGDGRPNTSCFNSIHHFIINFNKTLKNFGKVTDMEDIAIVKPWAPVGAKK